MIFEAKEITLKDGRTAVLKNPEEGDGAKFLDYITTACKETDFLLRTPEEWEGVAVESEERWIQRGRESDSTLMIACYVDGAVVGNCEISFRGGKKAGHRSVIAIAVLQKYWGLGIGSAMMAELIKAARAHDGCEIVELEFIEGNDRARALYEKFGFEIIAERPNAFKQRDGSMAKEFMMQLYL